MSGVVLLVRESRNGAREGRQWQLGRGKLTVGREKGSDIHLWSQSVESKHAVFEWSSKREAYIIRDLGTVNATYVNSRPLRNGSVVLRQGDAIRFGYERSHFFRIEEVKDSPSSHPPPPSQHPHQATVLPTTPCVSTQTSPPELLPPMITQQVPVGVQYIPSQPHTLIMPAPIQAPPPISQYYVPGYGYPTPPLLPQHSPNMAFQTFNPVQTTPVGMPLTVQHQTTPTQTPVGQHQATPTVAPTHNQHQATPTSVSQTHLTVEDLENPAQTSESSSATSRQHDGQRAVLSPSKANTSALYGQPAWWGEDDTSSEPELDFASPSSQILRDFTRNLRPYELEDISPSPISRLSRTGQTLSTDILRKQAISNSRERDSISPSSVSSSVLDFTVPAKRKKPPRLFTDRRPRSADPSPTRSSRSVSPSSTVLVATRKRIHSQPRDVSPLSSPTTTRKTLAGHVTRRLGGSLSDVSPHGSPTPAPSGHVTGHVTRRLGGSLSDVSPRGSPTPGSRTPSGHVTGHVTGHVSRRSASLSTVKKSNNAAKPPKPSPRTTSAKLGTTGREKERDRESIAAIESDPIIPDLENPIPSTISASEHPQNVTYTRNSRNDQTYTTNLSSEGSHSSTADWSGTSVSDPTLMTPADSHPQKRSRSEMKGRLGEGEGGRSDETFTKRPNSARKQWNTTTPQPADSLMLASIEARMRRLTKMAESTAALVSSSLPTQQAKREEQRGERGTAAGGTRSERETGSSVKLGTDSQADGEDKLPEWKFFNKEVDSIFHSIRAVEKWLRDINSNVSEIKSLEVGVVNASHKEGIDFIEGAGFESCDSEEGLFEDSIEERYYSCSGSGGEGL